MDLIIKLFGGFTVDEYNRSLSKAQEAFFQQADYFKDQISLKDAEIQRLTNLMLVEHGVIRPIVEIKHEKGPLRPINNRTTSWKERQKILEKTDLELNRQRLAKLNPELAKDLTEGIKGSISEDIMQDMEALS